MNKTLNEKNYLIFGSSSNIAKRYISLIGKERDNFYGVTSKANKVNSKYFKKIVSYKDIKQYSKIKFSNILIIASRNPTQGGTLNDFIYVNNLILNSLKSINYSEDIKPKFTFLSSFSVYDKSSSYIDDDTILMPSDYYGESKILFEDSLHDLANIYNADRLICRLPVFLYEGVSAASSNFLAKLSLAIASKSSFKLANPNAFLGAVFDIDNLVILDSKKIENIKIVNCSSKPDISFNEIGNIALNLGLKRIDWHQSERPSVELCTKTMLEILGYEPSAKQIIKSWLKKEVH